MPKTFEQWWDEQDALWNMLIKMVAKKAWYAAIEITDECPECGHDGAVLHCERCGHNWAGESDTKPGGSWLDCAKCGDVEGLCDLRCEDAE